MAGNSENAALWAEADVYIADLSTAIPADAEEAFSGSWGLVGLLDGEAGFVQSRSEEKTDHFAWGGILVRSGKKNFKKTYKFTALETNEFTRRLVFPGSSDTEEVVPTNDTFMIAFETRESGKVRRAITRYGASVDAVGDITTSETELEKYEITVAILPDGDGVLFDLQNADAS